MELTDPRVLSTSQLVRLLEESANNKMRFCFILGSGASVESGIPSGNTLEMQWMDYLMGEKNEKDTRELAAKLKAKELIEHSFEQIEAAWADARKNGKTGLPSKFYFDIYKLRFYTCPANGYRFLENTMENKDPSLGYHTLARLLTENNLNNLVITTNFDSLVEDALFLYTDKRPLVVNHESLAGYIESDIQRPIIAKVHRGLMFEPFNSPETTNKLQEEWRTALRYAFSTYTPIVIGYAGGDRSLMAFLEEDSTLLNKKIYWCFREASGLPEEAIQNFIEKKDGYFVKIDGFDSLMMSIGTALYHDQVRPGGTQAYLEDQYKKRIRQYTEQWEKLSAKPDMKSVLKTMNEAEQQETAQRQEAGKLTALDYFRLGYRAQETGDHQAAIDAYGKGIKLDPNYAAAYNNRGNAYNRLGEYKKAIADYTRAIELDPNYAFAHNNRGNAYNHLGEYEKAIADCTRAIELDPNYAVAYNNRGNAYDDLGEYEKAIADHTRAIELDPNDADAYYNRGISYNRLREYEKAIADFTRAIELDPNHAKAYNNRGSAYGGLGKYEKAIADHTRAIELDPNEADAYYNRGISYARLHEYEKAIADYTRAIELDSNDAKAYYNRGNAYHGLGEYEKAIADFTRATELNPNDAFAYNNRGSAYNGLGEYEKAIADFTRAIELNPKLAKSYKNRASAYRKLGKTELAEADEKRAAELEAET